MIDKLLKATLAAEEDTLKVPAGIGGTDAGLNTVMQLIAKATQIVLDVAVILGIIMIFVSAFLYVSSFGEESKAETAKKTLLWAVIGTVVAFLAKVIVDNVDKMLG